MLPSPILGLGGLMYHWGKALLYMPVDAPHSNLGFGLSRSWRAYVPLGRGATVHASGCPPLQFQGLAYLCLGGLMHHWGKAPLYMPVDSPHSNLGFGLSRSWSAYA